MAAELNLLKGAGDIVLVACKTDTREDRAYALYRIHLNGMPEEYMVYLARLFSAKTAGGLVLPGQTKGDGATILTEAFDKLQAALKRCEEWMEAPLVEVPEMISPVDN